HNMKSLSYRSSLLHHTILFAVCIQLLCASPATGYDLFKSRHPSSIATSDDGVKSSSLQLRHIIHHGAGKPGPRARRLDITPARIAAQADMEGHLGSFSIKTSSVKIDKSVMRASGHQRYGSQYPMSPLWVSEDVPGPDMTDKFTVLNFANMSEDAYKPNQDDPEWLEVGDKYNHSIPFGWEDSGIRGQVFSDKTNSTVVLSVKGTTVAVFEGNGTSGHDKDNDNLFGSCCCAQGGPSFMWRQVCDCQTGTYACDQECVVKELLKPNRYFEATLELFDEVIKLYPRANIITTGHSLGGVLASFIGLRHGLPAVTFEAYPQALAAARLGLDVSGQGTPLRKNTGAFHVGHTGDPIYMGTCNGATSFCSIAGYAFETICHTGKRCVYDVVKDWGWRPSTNTHRLRYAIENIYSKYEDAPPCEDEDVECVDCYLWKFENGTHTTKTSTSSTATSTSTSRTRTETCKTPGWWGCRDPTTTSAPTTTTSSTTTTTTSTCKTPGWFGCNDQTTTTNTGTTTTTTSTTTTCTSKGWFGRCLDPTTPATTTSAEAAYAYLTAPTAMATTTAP
ncbi:autophagy related lipase-like protein Atg15, partial [Periconia macrospinosa]